jgi:hypothetical protein
MLLDRATELAEKLERYQKLKAAADEADLVSTRALQVGEAAKSLAQARAALACFTEAGIDIEFFPANAEELTEKAATLRAIAAENPAGLADPPFNVTHEFTNRLKGLTSGAGRSIEEGWRRFVAENAPSGSDEVLDALGKLPQMRAGVFRIRQCRQKAAALAAAVPTDPAIAVQQLRGLSAEHGDAWTELTADGIPPTVLQFLRACAADGAALASLTKEVHDWLDARELLGSFRIRIG